MGPAVALCPPQRCPALPRRGEHVPWQRYSSSGTAGGWEERQSPRKKYRMGPDNGPPSHIINYTAATKGGTGCWRSLAPRSQSPRTRWAPWGGRWRRDAAAPMGAVFGEKAPALSPPAARILRPAAAPLPAPKISLSARCPGSRFAHSTRTSSCCRRLFPFGKKAFFFPSYFLSAAQGPEHFEFIANGSVPLHSFSHPLLPGKGWGRTHAAPHGTRGAPQAPQAASSIKPKEKGLRLHPPASEGSLLGSFPP